MRHLISTLLVLPALCCASTGNEAHFEKDANAKIADKRALYCDLSEAKFKERGWAVGECDGLLFTALRGIGCDPLLSQPAKLPRSENGRSKDVFVTAQVKSGSKQFTFATATMGGAL